MYAHLRPLRMPWHLGTPLFKTTNEAGVHHLPALHMGHSRMGFQAKRGDVLPSSRQG